MSKSRHEFTKMTILEFESWISTIKIERKISYVQLHHTWRPNYSSFSGDNHFQLQLAMKNYHVKHNGWDDIGQHLTIFPDGSILTGRSLENDPAGIFGFNKNALCIENVGDFDANHDEMTSFQKDTVTKLTALLCRKFSIPISSDNVVYHHWFDTCIGKRNNGLGKNNKSCPGTNFFGGHAVSDCEKNFLPLVSSALSGK